MKVEALKGITLAFRKNEFVSILGPSGCGKTTTLNIIGGLDHYTDGDLIIDGKSTKEFKDHDWDVYRNHKIGFIFQAYNLIPHENILENVELALTIAGLGKEERVKMAKEALDRVGLKDMYTKKPNELSGGQCQRVAIARALVNKPDILLADEPTGALDSVTSVQIMDLIKEISKEKLVIMVTHNPDLAKQYSTRIINLLDGEVVGDTNPYSFEEEEKERENVTKVVSEKEKAKMSWWTAFKLSAKNLWSKSKRTALIVVASSIGIVGVSAVLAVSQGVTGYIASMQDDMLSGYPVSVSKSSFDFSSILSSTTTGQQTSAVAHSWKDGKIDVEFVTKTLIDSSKSMSQATLSNDITEDYVQFIKDMPSKYYAALGLDYGINIKNNLFTHSDIHLSDYTDEELKTNKYSITGITAVCSTILENINNGDYKAYSSMVDSYTNAVNECLPNEEYVLSQYDVVSGKYPTKEDEMVLVLNHSNQITEFVLTLLGYYGQDEFSNAIYYYSDQQDKMDKDLWNKQQSFSIDDLVGKEYVYYPNDSLYTYNESYDPSSTNNPLATQAYDYSFCDKGDLKNGMNMKIVGVLAPKEGTQYGCMSSGLYYTEAFAERYIKDNMNSSVSKFIKNYTENNKDASGFTSAIITYQQVFEIISGIGFRYDVKFPNGVGSSEYEEFSGTALIGSSNSLAGILNMIGGGSSNALGIKKSATLTLNDVGGNDLPSSIKIYPNSFKDKYLVTDYLDKWNGDDSLILSTGKVLAKADRNEIKYTDNIAIIISLINGVVNIVTIALVCFTSLSLVVSTVMIGIITYVSVMERVKEIGVIRSLGGRKKDVSHLFNAETLIIGAFSGIFGLAVTYIIELILNLTLGVAYNLGMIANLNWYSALIIFAISILLTVIAGLIPARAAAKQDPVNALRSE